MLNLHGRRKCHLYECNQNLERRPKKKYNTTLFLQLWPFQHSRIMFCAVYILFNDLLLPNFSGNITFYIPLNVLCSATERNVDFHYWNGSFWKSKPWSLSRQPCWNLLCWLTFFLKRSHSLSLSLPIKSGAQRTLSGGFMATIYLSGRLLNLMKSLLAL